MSYFLTEESAVKKKSEANQEIEWKKWYFTQVGQAVFHGVLRFEKKPG